MYYVQLLKCQHCGLPLELRLFGLCSRLGPAAVTCLRCREPVALDRREWPQTPGGGRVRYGAISLLYAAALGILTGNFMDQALQLWAGEAHPVNLRYGAPAFQAAAIASAVAVLALQLYRVWASGRRFRAGNDEVPYPLTAGEFFLGLQWNLQFRSLLLLLLIYAAAQAHRALL